MSKSVSGQDVEDMLSSVRRLVSSELPRNRRASLPKGPGALVLTDAHRIAPSMLGHNSQPKSLEDKIAELEAAVSETVDDWEPDGSEDQDQHRPDRIVYKASEEDQLSNRPRSLRLSEIALIETGPANEDDADSSDALAAMATFRHGADEVDLARLEEEKFSEAPEPQELEELSDAPEAGLDEVLFEAPATVEPEPEEEIIESRNVGDTESPTEAPLNLSDEDTVSDIETDEEIIDKIATDEAFEEALAEAVAGSLPDAVIDEIAQHEDGKSSERVREQYGEPDAAQIDQASLQPLVAALIREELQGELGERITRNVRKLVRQEIQRALTVREVE
jgi:hypothetical protein